MDTLQRLNNSSVIENNCVSLCVCRYAYLHLGRRGKEKQLVANLNSTSNCSIDWCMPTIAHAWGRRDEGREVSQTVIQKVSVYTVLGRFQSYHAAGDDHKKSKSHVSISTYKHTLPIRSLLILTKTTHQKQITWPSQQSHRVIKRRFSMQFLILSWKPTGESSPLCLCGDVLRSEPGLRNSYNKLNVISCSVLCSLENESGLYISVKAQVAIVFQVL